MAATSKAAVGRLCLLGALLIAIPAVGQASSADDQINSLLDKARQESRAGRISAPAGDNLIETIDTIMSLIPDASPEALARIRELSALVGQAVPLDNGGPPAPDTPKATPPPASATASIAEPAPTPRERPPTQVNAPPDRPASPPPTPKPDTRPDPRWDALFKRGQEAQRIGDISAARRLYEAAANHAHRGAALALGKLYDPNVLRSLDAVGGTVGDPAIARKWYQQAATLGDTEAPALLQNLVSR